MSLGGWVISVFAVIMALVLFVPFLFTIDSEHKRFYLRWFLFTLSIDLSTKTTVIGIAGIHHELKKKKPSTAPAHAALLLSVVFSVVNPEGKQSIFSLLSVVLSHR